MSVSGLMSVGLSAMTASYTELQTTGHNIANANTAGYSRQTVDLASAGGQNMGAGFVGKGVDVATVQRSTNAFLVQQSQSAASLAAMDSARSTNLQQLQNAFPLDSTGMGPVMGNFLNAYVDLGNTPSDPAARQVIISDAQAVATGFSNAGQQIQSLQQGVTSDLQTGVAEVNSLAKQVAALNTEIAGQQGSAHTPNDLMDQRDQLIRQIGSYVKVSTLPASDGTLGVFIAGGQELVLGGQAQQMAVTQDPADTSRSQLSMSVNGKSVPLQDSLLVGGSLAGLMNYQNSDLVAARNQLGQMASAFAYRVNQVQGLGLNLAGTNGSPIFSVGAPQAVPNVNNARTATGAFATQATITVTDGTQLQASDYALKADPSSAGSFIVTRESDGQQFSMKPDAANPGQYLYTRLPPASDPTAAPVALGNSMDGFQVSFAGAAPAAADTFELQPVGNAAAKMGCSLTDPNGLAAASPVSAVVGITNTGTLAVAGLNAVGAMSLPAPTTTLTFTDSAGHYTYTTTDSTGATVTSGPQTWTGGQPIVINGFQLQLNGVPAAGDTVQVSPTPYPATNNGNALAMVNLQTEKFVGRVQQLGGSVTPGQTVTDAYSSTLADIGVRVQSAKSSSTISTAASQQADASLSNQAGVNLDEEAANLIQYQQSYQAAAKVLQVAQTVFSTMLQIGGG